MDKILDVLVARGWSRGVRGSSQLWVVAGAAAWLWRRHRSHRGPSTVYLEDLEPGQAIVITHHRPPQP